MLVRLDTWIIKVQDFLGCLQKFKLFFCTRDTRYKNFPKSLVDTARGVSMVLVWEETVISGENPPVRTADHIHVLSLVPTLVDRTQARSVGRPER